MKPLRRTPHYLADTSAWIEHLRHGDRELDARLKDGIVVVHNFVIGELLLGSLGRAAKGPWELLDLDSIPMADHAEVVAMIRAHKLEGTGIGWIDAHLLAAALIAGVRVLTRDHAMHTAATRVGVL